MAVRNEARIEVRLTEADRAFLDELVRERGATISAWVREKLLEEREGAALRKRIAAVQDLFSLEVDWIPDDPEALDSMLNDQDSPVDEDWSLS